MIRILSLGGGVALFGLALALLGLMGCASEPPPPPPSPPLKAATATPPPRYNPLRPEGKAPTPKATASSRPGTRQPVTPQRSLSRELVASLARANAIVREKATDAQLIEISLDQVRAGLKDPGSAQFENVRLVPHAQGQVVCGLVNAKNSFGGYVGFRPFVAGIIGAEFYEADAVNIGIIEACGL